ncbi:MAG TPA: GAF domain-containing sensor histidine kinase [Ktedonobacteraceae bacterium]|nr:GAF domain-containing sensor histidine kinase [Ktedonobacteraceae bacterium]
MSSESRPKHESLLHALQRLLELPATDVGETLHQTAQLVTQALHAEKVDTFLYDHATQSLIAYGTSETPMGTKEKDIGLDHLPLSAGGRAVETYLTGQPYWTGQAHRDPAELTEIKEDLGIKSEILVPLYVDGMLRGVVLVSSSASSHFARDDLHFLEAITHWIGVIIHRAELVEQQMHEAVAHGQHQAAEELLMVMAHDLGNYLTPLKARLDLMQRRAQREGHTIYEPELIAMNRIVMRLKHLVTDLLDVARLRQGIFALQLQTVDLVKMLWEVVPIWSTAQHPIEVQAPDHLIATADRDRIQQVLENLLSNATTHAAPGTGIKVTVGEEHHGHELWVQITVSNQGPPIPPELLATLFLPFAKGTQSKGIGLGLYLAERIAHIHHGRLTVRTEAGPTTHFILSWPQTQGEDSSK